LNDIDDLPTVHHENAVHAPKGFEAVSDDDHGNARQRGIERVQEVALALDVDACSRLVEDDDARTAK